MTRVILLLIVGLVIGYLAGWRDAQANDEPAYSRAIGSIGGATRDHVRSDVDARMDELQR